LPASKYRFQLHLCVIFIDSSRNKALSRTGF
jgi:hypothetical protein